MNVTSYQRYLTQESLAQGFIKVWDVLPLREQMLMLIGHRVLIVKGDTEIGTGTLHFDGGTEAYKLPKMSARNAYFGLSEVKGIDLHVGYIPVITLN
jgi:hypothetical protein